MTIAAVALVDVCWSRTATGGSTTTKGLFAAISSTGATGTSVYTSPNSITWTARTVPATGNVLSSICWSQELELFCAVSNTGTSNQVITSPDGVTWTGRTSITGTFAWSDIAWSPQLSMFLAVANTVSANPIMTSPDGITWTSRAIQGTKSFTGVEWSPQLNIFPAVSGVATATNIYTNINPTTGFNILHNFGTQSSTIANIDGGVVNIGNHAANLNIGSYADLYISEALISIVSKVKLQ